MTVDLKRQTKYTPNLTVPADTPRDSDLGRLKRVHQAARDRLQEFVAKAKEIGADVMLSVEGRKAEIATIAKDILRRLQASMDAAVPKAEERIERLENGLRSEGERLARSDAVSAARAHLILRLLETLDPSQRLAEFKTALDEDERETMAAAASAPRLWQRRFVPPKIVEIMEEESLKRADPAAYAELRLLEDALAVVEETARIVESFVRAEAGLEPSLRERLENQAAAAKAS